MENFFIPIGSILLSGVASMLISQYYGRKNLKTSQYINIITSERIKWIENVRGEFAILISSVMLYVLNSHRVIKEKEFQVTQELVDAVDDEQLDQMYVEFEKKKVISNIVEKEIVGALCKREIVEKSILLKMKLNPQEDIEIISILDEIIDVFSNVTSDVSFQRIRYEALVHECQNMFKREWDKVKEETKKK